MRSSLPILASIIVSMVACAVCRADIIEFTDKPQWEAAAGPFTTIDFTGFDSGTIITTQYIDLGIVLTDGDDTIHPGDYFLDDWGLAGHESIDMVFTAPMNAVAADYPGALIMELYWQGDLLYTTSEFGGQGSGWFAGVVSTQPFDFVVLRDWTDEGVFVDDLHFGPPIPAPSALVLVFGAGAFVNHRRRA